MKPRSDPSTSTLDLATAAQTQEQVVLRLYVAGNLPRSQRAITNVQQICKEHLIGRCDLEIIDIYQQPESASAADLIAAPTLIKTLPPPMRRLMGDLSQTQKVLTALDIVPDTRASSTEPRQGP